MTNEASRRPRVLVIKLSSLGDIFHALPTVTAIREHYGAEIHWVTQPAYRTLVEKFKGVDRVFEFPRDSFVWGYLSFLKKLRKTRYDLVVDLQGLLKSAFLVGWFARAGHRVGVPARREGAGLFYDAAPRSQAGHAVDRLLEVLRVLDIPAPANPAFPLNFPKVPFKEGKPRIAVIPCSRWAAKDWPVPRFIEVCREIQARTSAAIYMVGSPSDVGKCKEIQQGLHGRTVNTCGKTSLVGMASTLQGMDLVLSVDSGPMHVAAALGVPVLALFGVTDPARTGPYGPRHRVLMAEHFKGRRDLPRLYRDNSLAGQWDIPPAEVVKNCLEMLKDSGALSVSDAIESEVDPTVPDVKEGSAT